MSLVLLYCVFLYIWFHEVFFFLDFFSIFVLNHQIKIVFTPSQGNFSFTMENNNQSKYKVVESSNNGYTSMKYSKTKGSENITEEGWKDYNSQRIRVFAVRLCLLVISGYTWIVSTA